MASQPPPLESDDTAAQASQKIARVALETLRERQRSELEETERLLELVMAQTTDHASASTPTSLSTAASLLSGVNYGFVGRSDGIPATLQGGLEQLAHTYPGPPPNLWTLGTTQFMRNLKAMVGEYSDEPDVHLTPQQVELQEKLKQLTLNSTQIWEREYADGPIRAPWIIKLPYLAVCYLLDVVFEHRYVPSRFFLREWIESWWIGFTVKLCILPLTCYSFYSCSLAVETVARMPYFSYSTYLTYIAHPFPGFSIDAYLTKILTLFSRLLAHSLAQLGCCTSTRHLAFGDVQRT